VLLVGLTREPDAGTQKEVCEQCLREANAAFDIVDFDPTDGAGSLADARR
jgi:hypothetical protein